MRWGSVVSRFPDSPDSPSKTAPFNLLRPRVCSDYFSREKFFGVAETSTKYIRDHMDLTTGFAAITVLPADTVGRGNP